MVEHRNSTFLAVQRSHSLALHFIWGKMLFKAEVWFFLSKHLILTDTLAVVYEKFILSGIIFPYWVSGALCTGDPRLLLKVFQLGWKPRWALNETSEGFVTIKQQIDLDMEWLASTCLELWGMWLTIATAFKIQTNTTAVNMSKTVMVKQTFH